MGDVYEAVFDALGDKHRRRLLLALLEENPQPDRPRPGVQSPTPEPRDDRESAVRYQHVHLPKLDEYGFVTWRPEENEVVTGPRFDEIRPFLELLDEHRAVLPEGID